MFVVRALSSEISLNLNFIKYNGYQSPPERSNLVFVVAIESGEEVRRKDLNGSAKLSTAAFVSIVGGAGGLFILLVVLATVLIIKRRHKSGKGIIVSHAGSDDHLRATFENSFALLLIFLIDR